MREREVKRVSVRRTLWTVYELVKKRMMKKWVCVSSDFSLMKE